MNRARTFFPVDSNPARVPLHVLPKFGAAFTATTLTAVPAEEIARLRTLNDLRLLGHEEEPALESMASLCATLFAAPICLITFLAQDELVIKAAHGVDFKQAKRGGTFCEHAMLLDEPLVVSDASVDPVFASNPHTIASPYVRFYAGTSLVTSQGQKIGALCVIDTAARPALTSREIAMLKKLAIVTMQTIEDRGRSALADFPAIDLSAQQMHQVLQTTSDCVYLLDKNWRFTFLNEQAAQLLANGQDFTGRSIWEAMPYLRGTLFENHLRKAQRDGKENSFQDEFHRCAGRHGVKLQPLEDGLAVFLKSVSADLAAEERIHLLQDRHNLATAFATDGIWDWNRTTDATYFSPRFQEIIGFEAVDLYAPFSKFLEQFHPVDRRQCRKDFRKIVSENKREFTHEYRIRRGVGEWGWIQMRGAVVYDDRGKVTRIAGSLSDITARKLIDPLTGLCNRTALLDRLEYMIETRTGNSPLFAVVVVGINALRRINTSFGHASGDQVLRVVADRIAQTVAVPDCSIAAHLGGDEYAIILSTIAQEEDAATYALGLQTIVMAPIAWHTQELSVSASIGIAIGGTSSKDAGTMLEDAHAAMYQAKMKGRGHYSVFFDSIRSSTRREIEMFTDLRRAIDRNEFQLHYQPKVVLGTGEIIGFEALVRWTHPVLGPISPAEFIPYAEENGLILPIGRWTLSVALRQLKRWTVEKLIGPDVTMAVNLSIKQFQDTDLLSQIRETLLEEGVDASRVALEITESVLIEDHQRAATVMQDLRQLGVKLHLDDFGTGYSSLSYLHRFPFQYIKIDGSFVQDLLGKRESDAVVNSIIQLGKSLNMSVIAEGIETAEQATRLQAMGCDEGQGYFFSRPLSFDAMESVLNDRRLRIAPVLSVETTKIEAEKQEVRKRFRAWRFADWIEPIIPREIMTTSNIVNNDPFEPRDPLSHPVAPRRNGACEKARQVNVELVDPVQARCVKQSSVVEVIREEKPMVHTPIEPQEPQSWPKLPTRDRVQILKRKQNLQL